MVMLDLLEVYQSSLTESIHVSIFEIVIFPPWYIHPNESLLDSVKTLKYYELQIQNGEILKLDDNSELEYLSFGRIYRNFECHQFSNSQT
jgi:hypothetical protein